MDSRQLDALARALAQPARRRSLVLGIAGGIATLAQATRSSQPVAARQGSVLNQSGDGFGPGDSCVNDFQCGNAFPELGILYCADNGYVYGPYGGALHCCRYEGGSCGGPLSDNHAACCGSLMCNGGRCG